MWYLRLRHLKSKDCSSERSRVPAPVRQPLLGECAGRVCCPLKWHRQIVYFKSSRTRTITLNRRACLAALIRIVREEPVWSTWRWIFKMAYAVYRTTTGNTSNGTLPRDGTSRCTCRCMVLRFSYPVILCNRFRSLKFSTDTSNSLLISKIKPKFSVSCEELRNKLEREWWEI